MKTIDWNNLFTYDNDTGNILWKFTRSKSKKGTVAGSVKSDGRYMSVATRITGKQKRFYVHRIIYEMHFGLIPKGMCIDHVDRNGLNNRIENLRCCTLSDNQRNRRPCSNSQFGIDGVTTMPLSDGSSKFLVITSGKYIGVFKDFFDACCARKSSEIKHNYYIGNIRSES